MRRNPGMIYLDNAATTKPRDEVTRAMLPYLGAEFGNPSGIYGIAAEGKHAIEEARRSIAGVLGCDESEIYFTSGGSEADNWAIKSCADVLGGRGKHIITTSIEHHAVLNTCEYLKKKGYEITTLDVDEQGIIRLDMLEEAVRRDTILISVMYANNEIGTIQPVAEVSRFARKRGIMFHTDAVQAFGHVPVNIEETGADMLSASGHKLYGPKGTGFLYVRNGTPVSRLIHGGGQERGMRAGTENVAGIVGLGRAAVLAAEEMYEMQQKETRLRDYMISRVLSEIPYSRLNGHRTSRLPNNANFSFQFVEGESLLIMLDMAGVCASGGSACTAHSKKPSHVLLALGLPGELARGSLRMTLGRDTTIEDVDYAVDNVKRIVEELRGMSSQYQDFQNRSHMQPPLANA